VEHEEIYLHEHATIPVLEAVLNRWFHLYNTWRLHPTLGNLTLQVVYENRAKAPPQPVEGSALITA
jgi:hypothetical protein